MLFLAVYDVTAQDFTSSNLPIIIIDTDGGTIKDEPKIDADMYVIDNVNGINHIDDQVYTYEGKIAIEIRGNTAQMFEKKSYTLETRDEDGENRNVSLLGMPAENDWVLYGPYSDKSLMRNALAYHIGNSMGRWSPRTRHCEVIINDEYRGVYIFTEKIKIDKNRLDIAKLTEMDNSGDELTGGYIMSIDRDNPGSWNSPFMGRTGSVDVPISYVDPKYDLLTEPQREYIREYITDFEYALDDGNFQNPETGYRAYIDVISFIDYMIITELSRDLDGYRVSVYFHKDKDSKGGKLNMSPFWDYNLCFGNSNFFGADRTSGWTADGIGKGDWYEIPFWWDRFREDPYYETNLKYRWEDLREGCLNKDSLFNFIDSIANVLDDAQERNFEKFKILNRSIWPNAYVGRSYENEVNYLKNWVSDRIDWLDRMYDRIQPSFYRTDIAELDFSNHEVLLYPNPFINQINIKLRLESNDQIAVELLDLTGRNIYKNTWNGQAGINELTIFADELAAKNAVYFIRLSVNGKQIKKDKLIRLL